MPRFRVPLVALALLVVMAAGDAPHRVGRRRPPRPPRPRPKPQPPTQPTTGPGSSEARFGGVTAIEQGPRDAFLADSWLFVPADPLPGTPRVGGAVSPGHLHRWLRGQQCRCVPSLDRASGPARRGRHLSALPGPRPRAKRSTGRTLQDDVRGGLETLEQEGVPVDPTRVAVVGHSLGAEMAVVYAASAAGRGTPGSDGRDERCS